MEPTLKLDGKVRRCIEQYLAGINAALRQAGWLRAGIQNVVDDVRAQILEMLAGRTEGEPTLQDAQAIIAELDDPESYASQAGEPEPEMVGPRRFSRHALWGAVLVLLLVPLLGRPWGFSAPSQPVAPVMLREMLMVLMVSAGPLILGSIAISKIRRSGGRLRGLRLAYVEVLIPFLLILEGASQVPALLLCELFRLPQETALPASAFIIWCVLAWLFGRWLWRAINKWVGSAQTACP